MVLFVGFLLIAVVILVMTIAHMSQEWNRKDYRVIYDDRPNEQTIRMTREEAANYAKIWPGKIVYDPYKEWWGEK